MSSSNNSECPICEKPCRGEADTIIASCRHLHHRACAEKRVLKNRLDCRMCHEPYALKNVPKQHQPDSLAGYVSFCKRICCTYYSEYFSRRIMNMSQQKRKQLMKNKLSKIKPFGNVKSVIVKMIYQRIVAIHVESYNMHSILYPIIQHQEKVSCKIFFSKTMLT